MSWAKIVSKAMKSGKNAKNTAKETIKSKVSSAKKAIKEKAFDKIKNKNDLTETYRGVPYSDLDTTNALVPVGDNAWTTQRPLSDISNTEILSKLIQENPGKTAAIVGGTGLLGAAAMSEGDEVQEPSAEIEQITEILRQQGLSDEQIQEYLNNIMQAQGE